MNAGEVQSLGGWPLVERIGKGGMGEVWLGERVGAGNIRRRAAVKRILPKFQSDPVLCQRFLAEARITARLEHPNVVRVLEFGEHPELYLVLEYVDGGSMLDWLRAATLKTAGLPVEAALYAIAEAASGLDFAHRCNDENGRPLGIVHRDVTPANILVSSEGAVKVNDFGVARAADNVLRTEAGFAVGKLAYMAPEQARGEPIDRRTDVFSLGVCLWELLTLQPLLPRGSPADALNALAKCSFAPPSAHNPAVSRELDALVLRALRADKTERPGTADALSRSLRGLLAQGRPGYTALDFAASFREAIPRLAGQQRFAPPSSVGGAQGAVQAPAPVPAPVPASLPASVPVASQVSQPASALASSSGGWAAQSQAATRPLGPAMKYSIEVAPPPVVASQSAPRPAQQSSFAPQLAIAVGLALVLGLVVAVAAGVFFYVRAPSNSDDGAGAAPTAASPVPTLLPAPTALSGIPQVFPTESAPPGVVVPLPPAGAPSADPDGAGEQGGPAMDPNGAFALTATSLGRGCASRLAPAAHGTIRVTPGGPELVRVSTNGDASEPDRVISDCVGAGLRSLGSSIAIPAQAFDVAF